MFEKWDEFGGAIHCKECFNGDPLECEACEGKGQLILQGPPGDHIEGDANDAIEVVHTIIAVQSNGFPRTPAEILDAPALFISAMKFLQPYIAIEQQIYRKQLERDGTRTS